MASHLNWLFTQYGNYFIFPDDSSFTESFIFNRLPSYMDPVFWVVSFRACLQLDLGRLTLSFSVS